MKIRTLVLVTASALVLVPPCTASADPTRPRATRMLDVEIVDTPKGAPPHSSHHGLAVTDDIGWASLQTHGSSELSLRARSNDDHRGNVVLDVDLHRSGEGGDIDVASSVLFASGKRVPFGRAERPDGSIVELFVTAR